MVIKAKYLSNADGTPITTDPEKSGNTGFWGGLFSAVGTIGSSALAKPATTNYVTNNTEDSGSNTALYVGIAVAVIAVIIAAVVISKKK